MNPALLRLSLLALTAAPAFASAEPAPLAASPATRPVDAEAWRQDLAFLRDRLAALHPDPFGRAGRDRFDEQAARLDASLPGLSREQAIVELMRLVAMVRDGHTTLSPFAQPSFHILPLRFYLYGRDIYLSGADRSYARGLGGRLISIAGVEAAELQRRVSAITPGDNDLTVAGRMPGYVVIPEVLAGLGILRDPLAPVPVELEVAGRRVRLSVVPAPMPQGLVVAGMRSRYSGDWADTLPAAPPLWLSQPDKPYWFSYLPQANILYVQYSQATSDPADPMPAFARRLREEIAARTPDRVVLDLRLNSGGEGFWNRPLLLALIRSSAIEARGKLFVLIGRETFSAGSVMAIDLEKYTNAVFVGEPTGGAVQNYGNHEHVVLPNSRLNVMIATQYYQNAGPLDRRTWVAPQIAVDLTQAAYQQGGDPAMEAVQAYRPPSEVLKSLILGVPAEQAASAFAGFKADPAYRYLNTEPLLTALGYELIRASDLPRAVAVMRLAVQEHPEAANAHDSLGDAYRAAGERDAAIASYRRALAIAPGWESARRSLRELGVETPPLAH